jgi:LAS superfamily LD-carboxypeptidase LdcB
MKTTIFLSLFLLINSLLHLSAQESSSLSSQTLLLTGQGSPVLIGVQYKLVKEAAVAFEKMTQAAAQDSIIIQAVSSYRSFDRQLAIWNRKFTKNETLGLTPEQNIKKITEYSTIPGTSRHHWGTDIDLIAAEPKVEGDVLLARLFENEGPYAALKNWMDEHANSFGFHLVYTKEVKRKGFQYEPWHYSYLPTSKKYLEWYLNLELESILKNKNILGEEYFTEEFIQHYLEEYILGISSGLILQKKE